MVVIIMMLIIIIRRRRNIRVKIIKIKMKIVIIGNHKKSNSYNNSVSKLA